MKISTKGRYAVRAMLELAMNYGRGPVLMSAIAENQEISRKYLHAILTSLKSAGIVNSVRGVGGGFLLAKPPSKIRLLDVLEILEGPLVPVHCVEDSKSCHRAKRCSARQVWQEVAKAVKNTLKKITLEDLLAMERGKKKCGRRKRS